MCLLLTREFNTTLTLVNMVMMSVEAVLSAPQRALRAPCHLAHCRVHLPPRLRSAQVARTRITGFRKMKAIILWIKVRLKLMTAGSMSAKLNGAELTQLRRNFFATKRSSATDKSFRLVSTRRVETNPRVSLPPLKVVLLARRLQRNQRRSQPLAKKR